MKLIEMHILQSFPVTCLNRDDVGAPKSAYFGGATRARVSSQSWKRSIRLLASEYDKCSFCGKRGHYFASRLEERLIQEGFKEKEAKNLSEEIMTYLGERDKKFKEGHKTAVALYLSPGELDAIAKSAAADRKNGGVGPNKKGSLKKAIETVSPKDMADIAIFGRFVASDRTLTLEGAGLFSHALSTHRVDNDLDFFSAVDDLKPEDSEGAGHIGTLEFNSACYYRYIGLNLDLLRDADHLAHFSREEVKGVLNSFLKAGIMAVPGARKNSMLGHNPPSYTLGLVREGQPLSLVNAFETPVKSSSGYIEPSIRALENHCNTLSNAYNLKPECEVKIPEKDLESFCKEILSHV